jgi:dihydrofolate reductase
MIRIRQLKQILLSDMKKPIISLIAAIGRHRELGLNNDLIWKIPEDLKHFKNVTSRHTVIMGQKTYESIGKPLPDRRNIILSRDSNFEANGCEICHSIEESLKLVTDDEEVFFIGGASIYTQSIKFADKLYLTMIDATSEADTFFPEYNDFKITEESSLKNYQNINYKFVILERNA